MSQQKLIHYIFIPIFMIFMLIMNTNAHAADLSMPALTLSQAKNGVQTYSVSIQVLLIMTALTLLPSFVLMMTSFTRIIIVLGILRQAMGLPSIPTNQILVGLALFLSIFIMMPIFQTAYENGIDPYLHDKLSTTDAIAKVQEPFRDFMMHQTRKSDLDVFLKIARIHTVSGYDDVPMSVVVPSFLTSELKTAFQMGFMLFIPFLMIDLIVASILMAMGMMMLSPVTISLPFKIMLFVLIDGWALIVGTLASSFGM